MLLLIDLNWRIKFPLFYTKFRDQKTFARNTRDDQIFISVVTSCNKDEN